MVFAEMFVPIYLSGDPQTYNNYNASMAQLSSVPQALVVPPSLTLISVICPFNPSAREY